MATMTQLDVLTFCHYLGDTVVLAFVTAITVVKTIVCMCKDVCLIVSPHFGGIVYISVSFLYVIGAQWV